MASNVLLLLEDAKEGVTPSWIPKLLADAEAGGAVLENDKTFNPHGSLQAH